MFAVIYLQVCAAAIGGCFGVDDLHGPYDSAASCFTRIEKIIEIVAAGMSTEFQYAAMCAEIDEAGIKVGPPLSYRPVAKQGV